MSEQELRIKNLIREWIARKNGKVSAAALRDDPPILEQRIISSLHVMELVVYLEQLRKRPLELQDLQPSAFQTIDSLYANFFAGGAS